MSDRRNELLLAALLRAGKPVASDEVLDAVVGLGAAEGWSQTDLASISRGSVAKRLAAMVTDGKARMVGERLDPGSRRMTPIYEPADGFDPQAPVPPPPLDSSSDRPSSPYEGMTQPQVLAVLDAQDEMLEAVARFFTDMRTIRERTRQRLAAVGLVR